MTTPPPDELDLDHQRLALDRERLEIERQKVRVETRFVNRHLGILITALVSISVALLSAVQVRIASIERQAEIERAKIQKNKEIALAELEQDRRWKLDVATFIFDRRDKLFSSDPTEDAITRDLLLVTFPPEVTAPLFQRLQTIQPRQQLVWRQGVQAAENLAAAPPPRPILFRCAVPPSSWTGQLTANGGTYDVELKLARQGRNLTSRYLSTSGYWYGSYKVALNADTGEMSFVDDSRDKNLWVLRCTKADAISGHLQVGKAQVATVSFSRSP